MDAYWQGVYRLCGCPQPGFLETSVEGDRIRACWNSGLIVARRSEGLFGLWLKNVRTLMEKGHLPPLPPRPGLGVPMVDQVALAATAATTEERVRILPWAYNYCLPKRFRMAPHRARAHWDDLVHIHYHGWFNKPGFIRELRPRLSVEDERPVWLHRCLPFKPPLQDRLHHQPRIQLSSRIMGRPSRGETRSACPAFFVVGTGRCGTNLVREILNAHPHVSVVRESHWLPLLLRRFGNRTGLFRKQLAALESVYMAKGMTAFDRLAGFNRLSPQSLRRQLLKELEPSSEGTVQTLMEAFYRVIGRVNGARLVGDKTPDYGFCMKQLWALWPGARFLHIARDGRDVALSMSGNLSFRYLVANNATDWGEIAIDRVFQHHKAAMEGHLPLEAFFQLWKHRLTRIREESKELPADRYLEIRYEDLLQNPGSTVDRLGHFLDLHPPGRSLLGSKRDRGWMRRAQRLVRPNLNKNREDAGFRRLTEKHAEVLRVTGFDPSH